MFKKRVRFSTKIISVTLLFFLFAAPGANRTFAQGNKIIAVVGKRVVTLNDLEQYMRLAYVQLSSIYEGDELKQRLIEAEKEALINLIKDLMLVQAAEKRGIEIRDFWIEQEIKKIKARYLSESLFLEELKNQGVSLTELRRKIKDQLLAEAVVETEIRRRVFVSPAEITAYYEENRDSFTRPLRFRLKLKIFTSLEEAKVFYEQQKKNPDAEEFSEFGWCNEADVLGNVWKIISSLEAGQISPPVEIEGKYFVFFAEEKAQPYEQSLEEAKEQIKQVIMKDKFVEKFDEFIEELGKKFVVELYE